MVALLHAWSAARRSTSVPLLFLGRSRPGILDSHTHADAADLLLAAIAGGTRCGAARAW
jgi:hypothetical protein